MFQGIIRQPCVLCSQSSHNVVLYAEDCVTKVHAENAIDCASIQSLAHTNVSSSESMMLDGQSFEKLNLESIAACSFSNPVPHSGVSQSTLINQFYSNWCFS